MQQCERDSGTPRVRLIPRGYTCRAANRSRLAAFGQFLERQLAEILDRRSGLDVLRDQLAVETHRAPDLLQLLDARAFGQCSALPLGIHVHLDTGLLARLRFAFFHRLLLWASCP